MDIWTSYPDVIPFERHWKWFYKKPNTYLGQTYQIIDNDTDNDECLEDDVIIFVNETPQHAKESQELVNSSTNPKMNACISIFNEMKQNVTV